MPLNRLQREFEDRRQALVETLQRNKESLELSKQHQIYGAIKEIETFLKAIDHQRELQLRGDDFELTREGPRPVAKRTSLAMQRLKSGTGKLFQNVSVVFNEHIVGRTKRAVHATKHRVKLVKDVAKEVKRRREPSQESAAPSEGAPDGRKP